jgi:hypothetical protein
MYHFAEPLLQFACQKSGCDSQWLDRVMDSIVGSDARSQPFFPTFSGLCYDGFPLQLCVSSSRDGEEIILIGDPFANITEMTLRVSESVKSVASLLYLTQCNDLENLISATIDAIVPKDEKDISGLSLGALWLAAGVTTKSFALYTCASWGSDRDRKWEKIAKWFANVLKRDYQARVTIDSLKCIAIPECACIEGSVAGHVRAKIYFRLCTASTGDSLSFLPVADPIVLEFLETVIQRRNIAFSGIIFSIGFLVETGKISDSKIDVCCHCVVRKPSEWKAVFAELHRLDPLVRFDNSSEIVDREHVELACIGIGLDTRKRVRINTYWKPTA